MIIDSADAYYENELRYDTEALIKTEYYDVGGDEFIFKILFFNNDVAAEFQGSLKWINKGTNMETRVVCGDKYAEYSKTSFSEITENFGVCNGWDLVVRTNLESPKWLWPNNGDVLYQFTKQGSPQIQYKSYINLWGEKWQGLLYKDDQKLLEETWSF